MKYLNDQKGIAMLVELGLIAIVAGVILVAIYTSVHAKKTGATVNTPSPTATPDAYAGWKIYNSANGLGLSFKYPASWTVTENDPSQMCAGQSTVSVTPAAGEIESAFKQIGASYSAPTTKNDVTLGSYYQVVITKAGQALPKCGRDNDSTGVHDWNGVSQKYLMSTDEIRSGVLKGDWFTIYGSVEDSAKADPNAMIISKNQYDGAGKFTESTILPLKGAQYQVAPTLGENFGQYSRNTTIDSPKFKTTDLYKDTLLMLNSMQ